MSSHPSHPELRLILPGEEPPRVDVSDVREAPGVTDLHALAILVADCTAKVAAAERAMASEVTDSIADRKALRGHIQEARQQLVVLGAAVANAEEHAKSAAAGVSATAEDLGSLMASVARLAAIVGQPGDPAAAAKLSLSDMTVDEAEKAMADAALGSGLCRMLVEDRVRDAQRDRRMVRQAAAGASTSTAVKTTGGLGAVALGVAFTHDPVAFLHAVASLGWPGVAVLALVVIGGAIASRRRSS